MRRKRRTRSPEFKAKVALAAIQGDLTMAELIRKFDVHANQTTDWKKQLLSNAPDGQDGGLTRGGTYRAVRFLGSTSEPATTYTSYS